MFVQRGVQLWKDGRQFRLLRYHRIGTQIANSVFQPPEHQRAKFAPQSSISSRVCSIQDIPYDPICWGMGTFWSATILGVSLWRRIVALWPYVLIVISLAGLAYKFWSGSR